MNGERPSRWKSPWLWIGLSCGVLVLGVVGLIVVVNLALFKSFRETRERIREDRIRQERPLQALETLVTKDPDVKVVARDDENRRITLQNGKTGERFVLAEGDEQRLTIQSGPEEVDLQWGRYDGELRLGTAAGAPPSWVPMRPEMTLRPMYAGSAGGVESGGAVVIADASFEEIYRRFEAELARGGLSVLASGPSLSASSPDSRRSVFLSPLPGRPQRALLSWSELVRESEEE